MYVLYISVLFICMYVQRKLLNLPSTRRADHVGLCFYGLAWLRQQIPYSNSLSDLFNILLFISFYVPAPDTIK